MNDSCGPSADQPKKSICGHGPRDGRRNGVTPSRTRTSAVNRGCPALVTHLRRASPSELSGVRRRPLASPVRLSYWTLPHAPTEPGQYGAVHTLAPSEVATLCPRSSLPLALFATWRPSPGPAAPAGSGRSRSGALWLCMSCRPVIVSLSARSRHCLRRKVLFGVPFHPFILQGFKRKNLVPGVPRCRLTSRLCEPFAKSTVMLTDTDHHCHSWLPGNG